MVERFISEGVLEGVARVKCVPRPGSIVLQVGQNTEKELAPPMPVVAGRVDGEIVIVIGFDIEAPCWPGDIVVAARDGNAAREIKHQAAEGIHQIVRQSWRIAVPKVEVELDIDVGVFRNWDDNRFAVGESRTVPLHKPVNVVPQVAARVNAVVFGAFYLIREGGSVEGIGAASGVARAIPVPEKTLQEGSGHRVTGGFEVRKLILENPEVDPQGQAPQARHGGAVTLRIHIPHRRGIDELIRIGPVNKLGRVLLHPPAEARRIVACTLIAQPRHRIQRHPLIQIIHQRLPAAANRLRAVHQFIIDRDHIGPKMKSLLKS